MRIFDRDGIENIYDEQLVVARDKKDGALILGGRERITFFRGE